MPRNDAIFRVALVDENKQYAAQFARLLLVYLLQPMFFIFFFTKVLD